MYFKASFLRQLSNLCFPQMNTGTVASAAVASNVEAFCIGISFFPDMEPPLQDTVYSECGGVVVRAKIYKEREPIQPEVLS